MKKLENFSHCLAELETAHFEWAQEDAIYRTGIVAQFQLSFELGWKALQELLRQQGIREMVMGSPREVLQQGYKVGYLEDEEVWLLMLKKRNQATHVYSEAQIDELLVLIRDSFIPALKTLEETLRERWEEE